MLDSRSDAIKLLKNLNAPKRLITHSILVSDVALELLVIINNFEVEIDEKLVEIGAAVHDVGKINFTNELNEAGSQHEIEGEKILLNLGVEPRIAHFCVSHGNWSDPNCDLEDLIVALADKLWKGKRVPALEEKIIKLISQEAKQDYWEIFSKLDSQFESVAASGHDRLLRSII